MGDVKPNFQFRSFADKEEDANKENSIAKRNKTDKLHRLLYKRFIQYQRQASNPE